MVQDVRVLPLTDASRVPIGAQAVRKRGVRPVAALKQNLVVKFVARVRGHVELRAEGRGDVHKLRGNLERVSPPRVGSGKHVVASVESSGLLALGLSVDVAQTDVGALGAAQRRVVGIAAHEREPRHGEVGGSREARSARVVRRVARVESLLLGQVLTHTRVLHARRRRRCRRCRRRRTVVGLEADTGKARVGQPTFDGTAVGLELVPKVAVSHRRIRHGPTAGSGRVGRRGELLAPHDKIELIARRDAEQPRGCRRGCRRCRRGRRWRADRLANDANAVHHARVVCDLTLRVEHVPVTGLSSHRTTAPRRQRMAGNHEAVGRVLPGRRPTRRTCQTVYRNVGVHVVVQRRRGVVLVHVRAIRERQSRLLTLRKRADVRAVRAPVLRARRRGRHRRVALAAAEVRDRRRRRRLPRTRLVEPHRVRVHATPRPAAGLLRFVRLDHGANMATLRGALRFRVRKRGSARTSRHERHKTPRTSALAGRVARRAD